MAGLATRRVHRTVGILLAAPVILFTLTGLSLQFTEQLNLDNRYVGLSAVVGLYGVQAPLKSWHTDIVTQVGEDVFLNRTETLIFSSKQKLVCASDLDFGYLVILDHALVLIPSNLPDMEDMGKDTTPLPWQATACAVPSADKIVIETQSGNFYSTDLGLSWQDNSANSLPANFVQQAQHITTPKSLAAAYRRHKITFERFMQDLHSGRIAGATGIWIANFASIGLFVLALTGIWLWLIRPKR